MTQAQSTDEPIVLLNPRYRGFFSRAKAETYLPVDGHAPWRPGFLFELLTFEQMWCERCRLVEGCPILKAAETLQIDDSSYPLQWRHGVDGQPECSAFMEKR